MRPRTDLGVSPHVSPGVNRHAHHDQSPQRDRAARRIFCVALALGPVALAQESDNGGDGPSKEEACALLEDAFNWNVQYATDARDAGNQMMYQFFSDQAQETYLGRRIRLGMRLGDTRRAAEDPLASCGCTPTTCQRGRAQRHQRADHPASLGGQ